MGRSPNQTKNAKTATATSPAKAAAGKPTQDKFGKAFSQGVRNKTSASSPTNRKVTNIEVDYEILIPFGTCLVTFSQHGKSKHAYVYPLLASLTDDAERVYQTFRVFMQAVLFCNDAPDRKLKKNPSTTINVIGLVVTFDQQQDNITESNIGANLLKVVRALVNFANSLARRPFNGEASETFTYANEFRVGTDYTRSLPRRRHLGQVISPQDSVFYMERIFEGMTFEEIVNDPDIITAMYGSIKDGNALVSIARPGFLPQENGNEDHPTDDNHDTDLAAFVAEP
jgi:hypothetical protein